MKPVIRYLDTRGLDDTRPDFSEAIVRGIAPGGGLYIPETLPSLVLEEILVMAQMPYWRRAASVFSRFGVGIDDERIDVLMQHAYGSQWDDERIAPVTEVRADLHILELWHGPTSAFKDMALQCMPRFFSHAVSEQQRRGLLEDDVLILVATSGDTGKAALEGFADRDHTGMVVFYPADGVSDIQRLQMITQHGSNVNVLGVRGNFDDCQSAVKEAFADEGFSAWLHENHRMRLSSANSINWGRLLPQIVYYVSAYADMVASGGVEAGRPMDVCVPTGNFGNILGAYYAKEMGVPIGRLLCASNENNVLSDFFATGTYDISSRPFVTTPSPSMDILISSNLERLLCEIAGAEAVSGWMAELASQRRFRVDPETYAEMRELISADFVTNEESLETIRRVFTEDGYLLDPHTAVAVEVAERLRGEDPVLVVSTAHWAKFGSDVLKALTATPHNGTLPADYAGMSGTAMLSAVEAIAPGASPVPTKLRELDQAVPRFADVIDSGCEAVEAAVRAWL